MTHLFQGKYWENLSLARGFFVHALLGGECLFSRPPRSELRSALADHDNEHTLAATFTALMRVGPKLPKTPSGGFEHTRASESMPCKHTTWGEGFTLRELHTVPGVYLCWNCQRLFTHDGEPIKGEIRTGIKLYKLPKEGEDKC